jgi:hypothetical protein
MCNLVEIFIFSVNTIFDHANQFLTSFSEEIFMPEAVRYTMRWRWEKSERPYFSPNCFQQELPQPPFS